MRGSAPCTLRGRLERARAPGEQTAVVQGHQPVCAPPSHPSLPNGRASGPECARAPGGGAPRGQGARGGCPRVRLCWPCCGPGRAPGGCVARDARGARWAGGVAPRCWLLGRAAQARRQLDAQQTFGWSSHTGRPRPRRTRGSRWRGSAGSWRPGARRHRPLRSRSVLTAARRFDTASRDAGRRAAAPLAARAEGAPRRRTRLATRRREHAPPGALHAPRRRAPVLTSGPAVLTLRPAWRAQTRTLTCLRS